MSISSHIKSFVLRQGKITSSQQLALETLMPVYGIEYTNNVLDIKKHYSNPVNPLIVEIGFGMGTATHQIALNNPDINYLGIEVHSPGVGTLLKLIEQDDLTNLKVIRHDAIDVMNNMIVDNSLDGFHVFFPDPWHKKKHHKRRIIRPEFVEILVRKLKPGAYIHLATDWEEYATWMLDILNQNQSIKNSSPTNDYVARPEYRPLTKFEQRGLNLGHGVWDLIYIKK